MPTTLTNKQYLIRLTFPGYITNEVWARGKVDASDPDDCEADAACRAARKEHKDAYSASPVRDQRGALVTK